MILSRSGREEAGRVTIPDLLRLQASRRPDRPALIDAPNRAGRGEDAPRRLTWSEVDAAASAIAAELTGLGLPTDSVIGVIGPNSADMIVAVLGIIEARMIAAPMPHLRSRAEIGAMVGRLGIRALIAGGPVGGVVPAELARAVAADNFLVRFVAAFGADPPDGVRPLDACFTRAAAPTRPALRLGNPAEHVAMITWDRGKQGSFPVARSHDEWITLGLAALLEQGTGAGSVILSPFPPVSIAGLGLVLMPWLLTGATLVLHQPFDATVMAAQIEAEQVTHLMLPATVARCADVGRLSGAASLDAILVAARDAGAPPSLPAVPPGCAIVDARLFGEIAAVIAARGEDGVPIPVPLGAIHAPRQAADAPVIMETRIGADGTVGVRGRMTPCAPFPGRGQDPAYPVDPDGFVATGVPAADIFEQGVASPPAAESATTPDRRLAGVA